METIIVVDFGTSAVKSFLYDLETGETVDSCGVETPYYTPESGAAETDAIFWWEGMCQTVNTIVKANSTALIKGLAITNQQISCVFLDEEKNPVAPAILWMDTRCTQEVEQLKAEKGFSEQILNITGIPPSDSWGIAKLLWFRSTYPQKYKTIKQVASVDAFIFQKLCGRFVSDETNACFFHLDINNRNQASNLLDQLELEESIFPEVVPSGTVVGSLLQDVAEGLGLPPDLPIIASGSDQPCALLGMGVHQTGEAVINLGSGSFLLTPIESPIVDERLMTNISTIPNQWLLMGTHYVTGTAFRWLRDLVTGVSFEELDHMSSQVDPGADGLIFLPSLSGSGTPLWDSEAKGLFSGLTLQHTMGHLARAVMESTGYGMRNILEILTDSGVHVNKLVLAGGATVSSVWTQVIADILGLEIEVSSSKQATPLGAAMMAGVALGRFLSPQDAVKDWIKPGQIIKPNVKNQNVYDESYQLYLAWRDAEQSVRKRKKNPGY